MLKHIRNVIKAVPDVKPYLSNKTRWILAVKGGEGSGNFGHAGRPGEVGGSAPSGGVSQFTEVNNFEDRIRNITTHEETAAFDKDGNLLFHKTGEAERVVFTKEEIEIIKNNESILTHNHPFVASFSNGDLEMAAYYDIKEMRVVDSRYTYILTPPTEGWMKTESGRPDIKEIGKMKATWKRVLNSTASRLVSEGVTDANTLNEQATHAAMLAVSEKFGVGYVRIPNP